ncbi:hypothetical protein [Hyalangium minutum]|uniref:Uncharacterized protein n=1 Tax=Hyalangium minutum TaxID=394096 RepID=A0A085W5P3_9BACT|nr:hypothetical protein [Hyalangium minutum]KFE63006.1 hypothetical protein DB31_3065 [Hyalangium minutum]
MTTAQAAPAGKKKKPYVPPQVRSERLLVPDLFQPSCFVDPENPPNCL